MTLVLSVAAWSAVFLLLDPGRRQLSGSARPVSLGLTGGAIGIGLLGLTGSVILLLLGPLLTIAGTGLAQNERARRGRERQLLQLPVVVEILARRLSTETTVAGAIASLDDSQLGTAGLEPTLTRIRSGSSTAEALLSTPGLLGAALYATERAGGDGTAAIERLADRLRSAALNGREARAQSGQQVASAAVMTLMPPVVSVLYALSDERAANFYLHTPWGALVVVISLTLSGVGWVWMRHISRPRALT